MGFIWVLVPIGWRMSSIKRFWKDLLPIYRLDFMELIGVLELCQIQIKIWMNYKWIKGSKPFSKMILLQMTRRKKELRWPNAPRRLQGVNHAFHSRQFLILYLHHLGLVHLWHWEGVPIPPQPLELLIRGLHVVMITSMDVSSSPHVFI